MGKSLIQSPITRLLVITAIIFSPVFFAKFVLFDDDLHIFRNPNLVLPYLESLRTIWTESYRGFYIPSTYTFWTSLTHFIRVLYPIKTLEELPAFPFHAMNLIFHLGNVYLVWKLVLKLVLDKRAALIGAALFAFHPLQVESVAWATGFKDVICTFFCLLSLWYVQRSIALGTIFYIIALLSKPSGIVLPLVFVSTAYVFKREKINDAVFLALAWVVLSLPFAYITSNLQPSTLLLDQTPLYQRPLVAIDSLVFYFYKLILPFNLVQDYSRTPQFIFSSKLFFITLIFFIGAILYLWKNNYKTGFNFILSIALALLPVLGLVSFAYQNFSTVADHYFYFPMVVVALYAAYFLKDFQVSNKILVSCGVLLAVLTLMQTSRWIETKRLLHYTLSINPRSVIAHNNLAVAYETDGDLETSLQHYMEASSINPRLNHHHYNVGNTLIKMGRIQEAQKAFEETLVVDPGYAEAYFSLGLISEAGKEYAKAKAQFEKALELDPMLGKAGIKIGTTLVKQGKVDEGIRKIEESIPIDPRASGQGYFHLGKAYLVKKDREKARLAFQQSLILMPGHSGANEELAKLGMNY